MIAGKKVSLIVPTLNEEEGLARVYELIPKSVDEVVVVDGQSRDRTREIAAAHGAVVVVEPRRGYGRAYRTGFEKATGDIVATCDGDGTYPVDHLDEFVAYLDERDLDFLSCSRFPLIDPRSMDRRNQLGNRAMTAAASVLWLHRFHDILSGMWVFRRSALSAFELGSDGWNLSEEIKLRAYMALGTKFGETPSPYYARLGETKLMPWRVGVENLIYLAGLRLGIV
ncbi:MAG: glycosyltransferase family 2 protein [Elusimicrobia bacterium]|nr:glycosyltransferase family 2 protein [Elusimicrobiota bacterium]